MSALRAAALAALLAAASLPAAFGCGVECDAPFECDIRAASCQREVFDALRCVRGGERVDVPVHVVDAESYQQEQLQMIDQSDAEQERLWYRGLALLDLVSPQLDAAGATRVSLDDVAAFYDPDQRAVTVLDRGEAIDDVGMVGVLAHELVHAQQDDEHGFDALYERYGDSYDGWLALSAVTEGEAELYSSQLVANALGFTRGDVRWAEALHSYRAKSRRDAIASDDPLIVLRGDFVYAFGTSYVYDAFAAGGRDAVAALYDKPPRSSRQVVQGLGAAPPGGKPWVEDELDALAVPQLESFPQLVASARYGAYAFEVALGHWDQRSDGQSNPSSVAASLRADELTVQSNADGDVVVSWRLRFAAEQAVQLAHATVARWTDERVQLTDSDRDLIIVSSTRPELLSEIDPNEIDWAPLPAEPAVEPDAGPAAARRSRQPIRCRAAPIWH